MLKLGCTLPNLANNCLHKSTDAKFYPFTEADKDSMEKIREDVVGGPSIVFTRKAVVDETFIRKSTNLCRSFVGFDASQLYPTQCVNPCPPVFILVGIRIQKRVDSHLDKTRPVALKKWSCLSFNLQDLIVKNESFHTIGRQKKIDRFSVDGFCSHCNTVFEAMRCFYHFCSCQEMRPSLIEEDIKRGSRRRELDELRRGYIQEKSLTVIEMWECEWWRLYKTTTNVKQHIPENFPY